MKLSSPPNPVSRVRSISFVVRRSPHRCRASPPIKQREKPYLVKRLEAPLLLQRYSS